MALRIIRVRIKSYDGTALTLSCFTYDGTPYSATLGETTHSCYERLYGPEHETTKSVLRMLACNDGIEVKWDTPLEELDGQTIVFMKPRTYWSTYDVMLWRE